MIQSEIDQLIKGSIKPRPHHLQQHGIMAGSKRIGELSRSGSYYLFITEVSASALRPVFYADGVAARAASTSAATNPVTGRRHLRDHGHLYVQRHQ